MCIFLLRRIYFLNRISEIANHNSTLFTIDLFRQVFSQMPIREISFGNPALPEFGDLCPEIAFVVLDLVPVLPKAVVVLLQPIVQGL